MNRHSVSGLSAVLLATVLFASPALAAKPSPRSFPARGVVATFWQLLGPLVPAVAKARGTMDPNGLSIQSPPSPTVVQPVVGDTADARGNMDPNGFQAH